MRAEFIASNRDVIIARTTGWVARRSNPEPTDAELTNAASEPHFALERVPASGKLDAKPPT
jgi:hypothetical protein